jgi:hypothetical protein
MAEQLREDFKLIPDLLARPGPERPPSHDGIATVDEALADLAAGRPREPSPAAMTATTLADELAGEEPLPPVEVTKDQLGLFGS